MHRPKWPLALETMHGILSKTAMARMVKILGVVGTDPDSCTNVLDLNSLKRNVSKTNQNRICETVG